MANKQSYVVEFLGLEVSEAVKGKLVNAEEKLANAVLANTKLRNHVSKIHKILKDNGVEYSADDLNKCIDSFKDAVKETKGGEFSTTKKEVINLDINPDLFSECGLDISIDIDDEHVDSDIEEDSHDIETSEVVRTFVSENLNEMSQNTINETITRMKSCVENIDSIIYWTLRGNVSLVNLLDSIVSILNNVKGFKDNKFIKRLIRPISETVKVVDNSILKLASMSNSTDNETLKVVFNECMEDIMGCLWFMAFLPDYEIIETAIKTLLLLCLDSDTCMSTLGMTEVEKIDPSVIDKLFNVFDKNSKLLDLSNVNTIQDLLDISLDTTIEVVEFTENEDEYPFTIGELLNEFEEISYDCVNNTDNVSDDSTMIKINPIKVCDSSIGGSFKNKMRDIKNVIFS